MSIRTPVSGRDYQLRYAINRLITLALNRDPIEGAARMRIEWPLRDKSDTAVDVDLVIEGAGGEVLEIAECKEHIPIVPNKSLHDFFTLVARMTDGGGITKKTRFRFVTNAFTTSSGASLGHETSRDEFFRSSRSLATQLAMLEENRIDWEVAAGNKTTLSSLALAQLISVVDDPADFYARLYARMAAQMATRLRDGQLLDRLLTDLHIDLFSTVDRLDRNAVIASGESVEVEEIRTLFRAQRPTRTKTTIAAYYAVAQTMDRDIFDEHGVTIGDIFVDPPAMLSVPGNNHTALFEGSAKALMLRWLTDYETAGTNRAPLLVLGPFGCGKSSVLTSFASDLFHRASRTIPILLPLRDLLAAGGETSFRDVLRTHVRGQFKVDLYADEETEGVTYCLLCDGFDELNLYYARRGTADWVEQCYRELASLPQMRRDLAVVISSRPILLMDVTRSGAGTMSPRVEIQPFTEPELHEWCARYRHAAHLSSRFSYAFLEERNLDDVARTPIVLYMIARIFREEPRRLGRRRYSRGDVYTMFVDWTVRKGGYEQGARKHLVPANYRHILQDVAWQLFQSASGFLPEQELLEALRETHGLATPDHIDVDRNLLVAHMLQPVSGAEERLIEFTHQSFREYLVAERVMRVLETAMRPDGLTPESWMKLRGRPLNSAELLFVFDLLARRDKDDLEHLGRALQRALNIHTYWTLWNAPVWKTIEQSPDPAGIRAVRNSVETFAVRAAAQAALAFTIVIWIQGRRGARAAVPWQELRGLLAFCESLIRADQPQRGFAAGARSLLLENLDGMHLKDADLSGLSLDSADLTDALLIGVDFSRCSLQRGFVSRAKLNACDFSQSRFFPLAGFSPVIEGCDFSGADIDLSHLLEATFRNCTFDRARFLGVSMNKSTFEGCTWNHAVIVSGDKPHRLEHCTFDRAAYEFFERAGVQIPNPRHMTPPTPD